MPISTGGQANRTARAIVQAQEDAADRAARRDAREEQAHNLSESIRRTGLGYDPREGRPQPQPRNEDGTFAAGLDQGSRGAPASEGPTVNEQGNDWLRERFFARKEGAGDE